MIPTLPPRNIKNNFFVFCLSGETFLGERSAQRRRQRNEEGTRENAHQRFALSVCLSVSRCCCCCAFVFLLSLSNNILSLSKNRHIVSERETNQRATTRVRTLCGKKKNNNTANNKNGQTRTGANHRRARLARPHEVGQQEEQTRGKRTAERERERKTNVSSGSVKKVRKSTETTRKTNASSSSANEKTRDKKEESQYSKSSKLSTRETTRRELRSKSVTPASEEEKKTLDDDDDPRTFDLLGNVGLLPLGKKEGL